jgi:predicted AAA+ superfamily ATPase
MTYHRRLIDDDLDALFPDLAAIALEGAKGVGKTATASRRAAWTMSLENSRLLDLARTDEEVVLTYPRPLFIDEWQLHPPVWNVVRSAVDADRAGGQFLLAGSASPGKNIRIHSGAGRIISLHMRPMALCERGATRPSLSLRSLLENPPNRLSGQTDFRLSDYVREILASGLPGIRELPTPARRDALRSYIARAVDRDMDEAGYEVRRPDALRAWLTAYAAATSTTTSYNAILDAATPGQSDKPTRMTATAYREALTRMWLLDPLPSWWPTFSPLKRLGQAPKHHLADPALAASLLNATENSLLRGEGETVRPARDALIGALFESLATLSVRVMAQAMRADVSHLRTRDGDHEIDLIVEIPGGRVIAFEVKLAGVITDKDVKHLNWLHDSIGERLHDRIILNTGPAAYRRPDGVGVIPLALLGP